MSVTRGELGKRKRDYFLARAGGGDELLMEPFCWCGAALEQDYYCRECDHKCQVTLIACEDGAALAIAERLLHTNVDFHKFEVAVLAGPDR